jgi:hypothetical protein
MTTILNIETAITAAAIVGAIVIVWGLVRLIKRWPYECLLAMELCAFAVTPAFWMFIYTRYFDGNATALDFIKDAVAATFIAIIAGFTITLMRFHKNAARENE